MLLNFVFLIILLVFTVADVPDLPDYIKKCARKSSNFRECSVKNGNAAIPYLIKGDKTLGIPSLNPLKIPFIGLETSSFQMNLTDFVFSGSENFVMLDLIVNWDSNPLTANISLTNNLTTIEFNFKANGKLAVFSLEGQGKGKMELLNTAYGYYHDFTLEKKNGLSYSVIGKDEVIIEPENMRIHMDGLFNGNKELGDNFNRFLNENWRAVKEDFGEAAKQVFGKLIRSTLQRIMSKVPMNNWITDF